MALSLALGSTTEVQTQVYFLGLAAAFIAAAVGVPTRRIAYGAAALTGALIGVFHEVLLYSESTQHPDVPFNDDFLVAAVYLIPVVGAGVQIAWNLGRAKARKV